MKYSDKLHYDGTICFPYEYYNFEGTREAFRKYYKNLSVKERYEFFQKSIIPTKFGERLVIEGENDTAFTSPTTEDIDRIFWEIVRKDIVIDFYYEHAPKIIADFFEDLIHSKTIHCQPLCEIFSTTHLFEILSNEVSSKKSE